MKCTSSENLLELYLDGELPVRELVEMREHIEGCSDCASQYRRLEQVQSGIRIHVGHYAPPSGLERRVQAALRKAAREETQPTRLFQSWMAVAASILLFGAFEYRLLDLP